MAIFLEELVAEADAPAIVLASMLDAERCNRLSRVAKIGSKPELSASLPTAAIGGVLADPAGAA